MDIFPSPSLQRFFMAPSLFPDHPHPHRRHNNVDGIRHHPRRQIGLCPLLQFQFLPLSTFTDFRHLGRRYEFPRRHIRRSPLHSNFCPQARHLPLFHVRHHHGLLVFWIIPSPHYQLHQFRTLGQTDRFTMGCPIPQRRLSPPPPQPTLRSRLRRHSIISNPMFFHLPPRQTDNPRFHRRRMALPLCPSQNIHRVCPRAGLAHWLPTGRHPHHRNVTLPTDVTNRHLGNMEFKTQDSSLMSLTQELKHLISENGSLSIAQYMSLCLTHPEHGYYMNQDSIKDDFLTAPETSQMFGELIGAWLITMWQSLGSPSPFSLVELGAGTGTLMQDILRTSVLSPTFHQSAQVHLVEISPTLQQQQRTRLKDSGVPIVWHQSCDTLPSLPTFLVANEFLDALPIHQWINDNQDWRERVITLDEHENLQFSTTSSFISPTHLPTSYESESNGAVFENSPAREAIIDQIAHHLKSNMGIALFIDYGHWHSGFGDTLQTVKSHTPTNILEHSGQSDLTSHVDFQPLTECAQKIGCNVSPPTSQGSFLLELGLVERAKKLSASKPPKESDIIHNAVDRLSSKSQMGSLFKVMGFGNFANTPIHWPGFTT